MLKPVKIVWAYIEYISIYAARIYSTCAGNVFCCRLKHQDLKANLLILLVLLMCVSTSTSVMLTNTNGILQYRLYEPWYVSNRQIHEDLGIPFFADHIRALTESFNSKISEAGNPLNRQLGRHLCLRRTVSSCPWLTKVDWCSAGQSRLPLVRRPSRRND
jgi:hypothetical protein